MGEREVFLSFKLFPWFKSAAVSAVLEVERPQPHHLYWPQLDIDLHVDSIEHPAKYPLVAREKPRPITKKRARPKAVKVKASAARRAGPR